MQFYVPRFSTRNLQLPEWVGERKGDESAAADPAGQGKVRGGAIGRDRGGGTSVRDRRNVVGDVQFSARDGIAGAAARHGDVPGGEASRRVVRKQTAATATDFRH